MLIAGFDYGEKKAFIVLSLCEAKQNENGDWYRQTANETVSNNDTIGSDEH